MPKKQRTKKRGVQNTRPVHFLPNRRLFAAGIALLLVGYTLLNQPPVSGFLSHTLAPILLTLSYTVLIPASLLPYSSNPKQTTS